MTMRYFTVEEANAALPELEPIVGRMLELRRRISHQSQSAKGLLSSLQSDFGGPEVSQLVVDFEEIDLLVKRLSSYGCVLKSIDSGLVDFLCERDGRDVYLCWRLGEPSVQYYHEIHTGYQDRMAIE
ncbi:MAG: DUF2203 domain-containing protein [Anaerolineae bacterium]|nr:DUF2203 domain-containing protein [Promineifilum sp.]MCZ2115748.1 DUF2203 domain-containing protein [Anaerolineae bacterium]